MNARVFELLSKNIGFEVVKRHRVAEQRYELDSPRIWNVPDARFEGEVAHDKVDGVQVVKVDVVGDLTVAGKCGDAGTAH